MARQPLAAPPRELTPRGAALPRDLWRDRCYASLWLLPRLALGWLWLEAGWRQLGEQPGPVGHLATGSGLPAAFGLPAIALTLAGIALILGLLTGPAAFVGGWLSASLWAGGSPFLAALQIAAAVGLVLGWKHAGWLGLDRWLLPLLGVPVQGGALVGRQRPITGSGVTPSDGAGREDQGT